MKKRGQGAASDGENEGEQGLQRSYLIARGREVRRDENRPWCADKTSSTLDERKAILKLKRHTVVFDSAWQSVFLSIFVRTRPRVPDVSPPETVDSLLYLTLHQSLVEGLLVDSEHTEVHGLDAASFKGRLLDPRLDLSEVEAVLPSAVFVDHH
jgi:hypothetical protein